MPWWGWVIVVMLVFAFIGGSAEKDGRGDVVQAAQNLIDTGWIILIIGALVIVAYSC